MRSLSSAYSKETFARGVVRVTTSNGIPIGPPSQVPEPKSAWSPVSSPIERISVAEFGASGSLSTRRFQGFERGKTEQRGALGSRSAAAEPERQATTTTVTRTRAARIPRLSALLALGLEFCLVRALLGLVRLERLGRIDVAERRVVRRQLASRLDVEPLREHSAERLDRHLPEARQLPQAPVQLGAVGSVVPELSSIAAVLVGDDRGELLHPARHVAGEAVDRRLLAKRSLDLGRIRCGNLARIE